MLVPESEVALDLASLEMLVRTYRSASTKPRTDIGGGIDDEKAPVSVFCSFSARSTRFTRRGEEMC